LGIFFWGKKKTHKGLTIKKLEETSRGEKKNSKGLKNKNFGKEESWEIFRSQGDKEEEKFGLSEYWGKLF